MNERLRLPQGPNYALAALAGVALFATMVPSCAAREPQALNPEQVRQAVERRRGVWVLEGAAFDAAAGRLAVRPVIEFTEGGVTCQEAGARRELGSNEHTLWAFDPEAGKFKRVTDEDVVSAPGDTAPPEARCTVWDKHDGSRFYPNGVPKTIVQGGQAFEVMRLYPYGNSPVTRDELFEKLGPFED